jgi:E3 ubiquitin-protein ligase RFWD3
MRPPREASVGSAGREEAGEEERVDVVTIDEELGEETEEEVAGEEGIEGEEGEIRVLTAAGTGEGDDNTDGTAAEDEGEAGVENDVAAMAAEGAEGAEGAEEEEEDEPEEPEDPGREEEAQEAQALQAPHCSQGDGGILACSICLEATAIGGPHQVSSLACGHCFGHACIVEWLTRKKRGNGGRCPQCNRKSKLADVRKLFVPAFRSFVDTAELDEARANLAKVGN